MIKLDVTSERHGDDLITKSTGKVAGERAILAQEMRAVLKEFHSIDDGATLVIAFGEMMEELAHDKR